LRADGQAAARAKFFLDLGFDPDDTVAMMRVVIENLGPRRISLGRRCSGLR
jgi:adenylate cyclase